MYENKSANIPPRMMNITVGTMNALANALGVKIEDLMGET